jgi:drug/metabolite transporter (DMT)-like permease
MKPERVGDLFALACAFVCGLGNIPAKAALENLSTELYTFIFFIFAFIISGFALFRKADRDEIFKIDYKTLSLIFALSIIFTIALYLFLISLKLIEPATVSFLSRFEVIVTVVLAYMILKERLRFIEIIGGMVAVVGVIILKYKTNLVISHAATLMVISAFFFAAAEIIIKKNIKRLGTMRFLFYRNFFMIFMMLVILLKQNKDIYLPGNWTLFMILLAAILLPVLGRATYMESLKRINISRAALISTTTPLFTALFAFLILSSFPMPIEWLGGALIVAGVMVIKLTESGIRYS